MQKTLAVKDALSRMTAGLPDAIVQTRFAGVLDYKDALLAAASCPKFKLRWLRDAGRRERVKELLTAECHRTTAPAAQGPVSVPTTSDSQGGSTLTCNQAAEANKQRTVTSSERLSRSDRVEHKHAEFGGAVTCHEAARAAEPPPPAGC
ncbi:unnamed protein product [Pleuronectes platessa]|uniref:Uncharacterized protein n=1 Tax=Pleuronectes platessa TaxID=8262 RepID=A0A9N7UV00_PLEPL|nr:unnamed protein product [Pleuronectes platessa]